MKNKTLLVKIIAIVTGILGITAMVITFLKKKGKKAAKALDFEQAECFDDNHVAEDTVYPQDEANTETLLTEEAQETFIEDTEEATR